MTTLSPWPQARTRLLGALGALVALSIWIGTGPTAVARPAADDEPDITNSEQSGGDFANIVTVTNRTDNRMRVRGNIEVNRILGDEVTPLNQATAYAMCTDCQTFSIALQINLISVHAKTIRPQNAAIALNYSCTRCVTVARAIQYVVQVEDPREEQSDVSELVRELNRELRAVAREARSGRMTVVQAESRINAVIERFRSLGMSLYEDRNEQTETTTPLRP